MRNTICVCDGVFVVISPKGFLSLDHGSSHMTFGELSPVAFSLPLSHKALPGEELRQLLLSAEFLPFQLLELVTPS